MRNRPSIGGFLLCGIGVECGLVWFWMMGMEMLLLWKNVCLRVGAISTASTNHGGSVLPNRSKIEYLEPPTYLDLVGRTQDSNQRSDPGRRGRLRRFGLSFSIRHAGQSASGVIY